MGRLGSTTSPRARQMRRVLARWQRSGLTLREFGQQRGFPLSTLTWWRQVFRRAGEPEHPACKSAPVSNAVVFTARLVLELTPREWKRLQRNWTVQRAA